MNINIEEQIKHNVPLSRYNSWHVGGLAEKFFQPRDKTSLLAFLQQFPDETVTFLGLGSNVLIRDGGVLGTVISTQKALTEMAVHPNGTITVGAGVSCPKLAKFAAHHGLADLTFLAGIPGTVGGALAMNAGCYGMETWTQVESVMTCDRKGKCYTRTPQEYQIGYRHVVGPNEEWFLGATFKLQSADVIQQVEKIKACLKSRAATQPIGTFSGGSVFKNPMGDHAGRLIEAVGLKGCQQGQAMISEKHANFFINSGRAMSIDIEKLIKLAQNRVWENFGITLVPEVRIVGEHQ